MWTALLSLALLFAPSLQQGPECMCVEPQGVVESPTVLARNPQGDRMYTGTQFGIVQAYARSDGERWAPLDGPVFMNLTEIVRVNPGYDEQGFLSMAFHPDFETNRRLFVYYSATKEQNEHWTRLSELQVTEADRDVVDEASERVLLEVRQASWNHNGGEILMGYQLFEEDEQEEKKGYLILTVGDGGGSGDPEGNGQNTQSLPGSILLIDVDNVPEGATYGIPDENPFKDDPEAGLPEIFAYGFRNPWRNSIDRETRTMFIGDVGQNRVEEVDVLTMADAGANYGWNIYEGTECYNNDNRCVPEGNPGRDDYEWPIHEYFHDVNQASVTGGFVYRGEDMPEIEGHYVYADWVRGTLGGLVDEGGDTWTFYNIEMCGDCSARNPAWQGSYDQYIQTFGEDSDGEIYFAAKENRDSDAAGNWYKLVM